MEVLLKLLRAFSIGLICILIFHIEVREGNNLDLRGERQALSELRKALII